MGDAEVASDWQSGVIEQHLPHSDCPEAVQRRQVMTSEDCLEVHIALPAQEERGCRAGHETAQFVYHGTVCLPPAHSAGSGHDSVAWTQQMGIKRDSGERYRTLAAGLLEDVLN